MLARTCQLIVYHLAMGSYICIAVDDMIVAPVQKDKFWLKGIKNNTISIKMSV